MTGLFISLDEYYTDPIEEELQGLQMREEYIIIPSISNSKEWLRQHNYTKSRIIFVISTASLLRKTSYGKF